MSRSHNNQLNTISLFDEAYSEPSHKRTRDMARHHPNTAQGGPVPGQAPQVASVKVEEDANLVSYTPTYDGDYVESDRDDRRPSKIPKINKDGVPRKPRQPRPKLLKWSDNDWKNVVLGIVWACGETGVQIPFDQAAQVVGESCTAGALQQAILKLRGKQIDEGYEIPSLRMAWTRKNKRASSSSCDTNAKSQQATGQNRMIQSRPSLVVKLKATVPVAKNGRAAIIQDNGGSKGPRGGGFGLTFPMADIRSTGNQGLTIISGHPSVPSSFGGNYPDIVKQRVPTQYKRGVGMDFNFEDHMPNMEACNFAEDVKDHAEYEFIDQGEFIDDGEFIVHGESIGHGEFIVHGESLDDSECIVHGESIGHGESLDVGEFVGHGESVPGGEFIGHDDPIDDGEFIGHGESIDDGSQEDLLASSETDTKPSSGFLPEMSSPLDNTYQSPYSFLQTEDSSGLHSLDCPSPSYQGLQGSSEVPPRLDAGHFPDLFAHDVIPDCGFEYDFNAGY